MGGNLATSLLPLIPLVGASAFPAAAAAIPAKTASFMQASGKAAQLAASVGSSLTPMPWMGLGLTAASTALSGYSEAQNLAYQENIQKLQTAKDALNLAEKERETQRKLRKVLAQQSVYYGATGMDPGSGSALSAAQAAKKQADEQLSLYAAQRSLNHIRPRRRSRADIAAKSLIDFGRHTSGPVF